MQAITQLLSPTKITPNCCETLTSYAKNRNSFNLFLFSDMRKLYYRFFVLVCLLVLPSWQKEIELRIGTLLPNLHLTYGLKNAIELAAETVKDAGLLKGYKLVFIHKETQVRKYLFIVLKEDGNATHICHYVLK